MRLRAKLLTVALRKSRLLTWIPVLVIYCLVPGATISTYLDEGAFEASNTFVYSTQLLFPVCSVLWPMGYLHIWIEGDGCEALRAYSMYHKSCTGEMLLLFGTYLGLILPTILFGTILCRISWLEYVRLSIQIAIAMCCFYFLAMLLKNVTLGSIPVLSYLFFCFCISGSADLASLSLLEPFISAKGSNWMTLICALALSLLLFLFGHLLDRFGRICY